MPRPRFMRAQTDTSSLKPGPTMRLLPVVILAAVFMLGFRIQVVVRDLTNFDLGTFTTATLQMGQTASAAQATGDTAPAVPTTPPTGAPAAAPAPTDVAPEAPAAVAETAAGSNAPPLPINFDPSTLTKSEIDTLQRLAERRDMITAREREIENKEGLLKAAEARIDGKVAQLQDLEKNIKGLLTQYDAQKQQEIEQLVKIYSAMKPKEAARIFDTLEMPILVRVIQTMKETKVAPIMAAMASEKATALTEELTLRKQLPTASAQ
jgi:flagellar motility protein MotE (MotC chaperone)